MRNKAAVSIIFMASIMAIWLPVEAGEGSRVSIKAPDEGISYVRPGETAHIVMSSVDNNRVSCPENIVDVVYSNEKGNGIDVKIVNKSAFIKFKVAADMDGRRQYSKEASEFFITCLGEVYTVIAHPRKVQSQTVVLERGKGENVRENIDAFSGMPFEKKAIEMIRKTMTNEIPESWEVKTRKEKIHVFRDMDTVLAREVRVEGTGLRLMEYSCAIRKGAADDLTVNVKETDFLNSKLTKMPLAVTVERNSLKKGEYVRVFIVERYAGK